MKEAAGEANMTVITIVLIAIVLGVGTVLVTNLMNSTGKSSACQSAGGHWRNGQCCKEADGSKCTTFACTKATADDPTKGIKAGDWTCVAPF